MLVQEQSWKERDRRACEKWHKKLEFQRKLAKIIVRELSRREGVEAHEIGPSASLNVKADGPCVVLVVVD